MQPEMSIAAYIVAWLPYLIQLGLYAWLTMQIIKPLRAIANSLDSMRASLRDIDRRLEKNTP